MWVIWSIYLRETNVTDFFAEDLSADRTDKSSFYFHTVTVQITSQSRGFSGNQNILINNLSMILQYTVHICCAQNGRSSNINCPLRNDIRMLATSRRRGLLHLATSQPDNCL